MDILWELFEFAVCLSEAFIVFFLLRQKLSCKSTLLALLLVPVLAASTFAMNLLELDTVIVTVISALIHLTYAIFAFNSAITSRVIWGFTPSIIFLISNYVVSVIMTVFTDNAVASVTPSNIIRVEAMLFYAFINVVIYVILSMIRKKEQFAPIYLRFILSGLTLFGLAATTILLNQSIVLSSNTQATIVNAIVSALVLIMSIAIIAVFHHMGVLYKQNLKAQQDIQKSQLEAKNMEQVSSMYEHVRGWRHDMHNYMTTLFSLLENNNIEEMARSMKEFDKSIRSTSLIVSSGNPAIDATISTKLIAADNAHITVSRTLAIPQNLNVNTVDVCAIISNLMDNAIEAAQKLPDGHRELSVDLSIKGNMLSIDVSNTSDGKYEYTADNELKTSKADNKNHGLGLSRVKKLAEQNNGRCLICPRDDSFEVYVLLSLEG